MGSWSRSTMSCGGRKRDIDVAERTTSPSAGQQSGPRDGEVPQILQSDPLVPSTHDAARRNVFHELGQRSCGIERQAPEAALMTGAAAAGAGAEAPGPNSSMPSFSAYSKIRGSR